MASDQPAYRKLGGKARDTFSVAIAASYQLYLGRDHLLLVANHRFTETYKRFYFRDIQALVVTESRRRRYINVILGFLAAAGALTSWGIGGATSAFIGWVLLGSFMLFFGLCFAINMALGPTCACYVKTAVHTQKLPSLKRIRTAQKIFDRVNPLIAAAQGVVPAEPPQSPPPAAGAAAADAVSDGAGTAGSSVPLQPQTG